MSVDKVTDEQLGAMKAVLGDKAFRAIQDLDKK